MTLDGVRFNCITGVPCFCKVEVVKNQPTLERNSAAELFREVWIRIIGGVTGYEGFCLEGKHPANQNSMILHGWWACSGTPNQWDALYFHGLQMKKLFKELDKYKYL